MPVGQLTSNVDFGIDIFESDLVSVIRILRNTKQPVVSGLLYFVHDI